jgi:hypothetical protein
MAERYLVLMAAGGLNSLAVAFVGMTELMILALRSAQSFLELREHCGSAGGRLCAGKAMQRLAVLLARFFAR